MKNSKLIGVAVQITETQEHWISVLTFPSDSKSMVVKDPHAAMVTSQHWLPRPCRHSHVMQMITNVRGPKWHVGLKTEQGFIDEDLVFLPRGPAYTRAIQTGQFKRDPAKSGFYRTLLFSEDVW